MAWWMTPFDPHKLRAIRGQRTPEEMDKLCRLAPGVWARVEADGRDINLYGRAAIRDALHLTYDDLCIAERKGGAGCGKRDAVH